MMLAAVIIICLTVLILVALLVGLVLGLKKDPKLLQIQELRRVAERRRSDALNLTNSYQSEKVQNGLLMLKECDELLIRLAKTEAEMADERSEAEVSREK
jgi:hypothetical protein